MKQLKTLFKLAKQISLATSVFISRLGFLPANFSPLGSYGFFGNPILFGISIIMFDLFVKGLYPGFLFTYLGFASYAVLGWIAKHKLKRQMVLLPMASFLFFLISNFGVWWYWYDHTYSQLILCYTLAIPFYVKTLMGDVFFGYTYLVYANYQVLREKTSSVFA
jgi:hypothetical protein